MWLSTCSHTILTSTRILPTEAHISIRVIRVHRIGSLLPRYSVFLELQPEGTSMAQNRPRTCLTED